MYRITNLGRETAKGLIDTYGDGLDDVVYSKTFNLQGPLISVLTEMYRSSDRYLDWTPEALIEDLETSRHWENPRSRSLEGGSDLFFDSGLAISYLLKRKLILFNPPEYTGIKIKYDSNLIRQDEKDYGTKSFGFKSWSGQDYLGRDYPPELGIKRFVEEPEIEPEIELCEKCQKYHLAGHPCKT